MNRKLMAMVFRVYAKLHAKVEVLVRDYGLGVTEFGLLEAIYTLGPQPIQVLSRRILVTSGSMTYTVNRLESKGYIRREHSAEDGRVTYLLLTDEGLALVKEVIEVHDRLIDGVFSKLSDQEKREAFRALNKLHKFFKSEED